MKKDGKSKTKAVKALKAVKRSTWRQSRKPRHSTVFHRPKTLKEPRKPKYPRLRYAVCRAADALVSALLPAATVSSVGLVAEFQEQQAAVNHSHSGISAMRTMFAAATELS